MDMTRDEGSWACMTSVWRTEGRQGATAARAAAWLQLCLLHRLLRPPFTPPFIICLSPHLARPPRPPPPLPPASLEFMDPSVDTTPIAPALAAFFDDVLNDSVSRLNFRAIVDGLGGVLFQYPFRWGGREGRGSCWGGGSQGCWAAAAWPATSSAAAGARASQGPLPPPV
jgi:hypothetical protein